MLEAHRKRLEALVGEVTPDVASDTAIVLGVRDPLKGSYLAMIPPTGVEARESRHDTTERRDLAAAFQPREGQRRHHIFNQQAEGQPLRARVGER